MEHIGYNSCSLEELITQPKIQLVCVTPWDVDGFIRWRHYIVGSTLNSGHDFDPPFTFVRKPNVLKIVLITGVVSTKIKKM